MPHKVKITLKAESVSPPAETEKLLAEFLTNVIVKAQIEARGLVLKGIKVEEDR